MYVPIDDVLLTWKKNRKKKRPSYEKPDRDGVFVAVKEPRCVVPA